MSRKPNFSPEDIERAKQMEDRLANFVKILQERRKECEAAGKHKEIFWFSSVCGVDYYIYYHKGRIPGRCGYCFASLERTPTAQEWRDFNNWEKSLYSRVMV